MIKPIRPLTEAEARKALDDYRARFPMEALAAVREVW